jgi:hypothetical protein
MRKSIIAALAMCAGIALGQGHPGGNISGGGSGVATNTNPVNPFAPAYYPVMTVVGNCYSNDIPVFLDNTGTRVICKNPTNIITVALTFPTGEVDYVVQNGIKLSPTNATIYLQQDIDPVFVAWTNGGFAGVPYAKSSGTAGYATTAGTATNAPNYLPLAGGVMNPDAIITLTGSTPRIVFAALPFVGLPEMRIVNGAGGLTFYDYTSGGAWNFVDDGVSHDAASKDWAVPQTRTLSINGVTGTLASNNTWTVAGGGSSAFATNSTYAVTVTGPQSNVIATALQPAALAGYLPLTGGTLSGGLTVHGSIGLGTYWFLQGLSGQIEFANINDGTQWLTPSDDSNVHIFAAQDWVTGLGYVTTTVTNNLLSATGNGSGLTGITAAQVGADPAGSSTNATDPVARAEATNAMNQANVAMTNLQAAVNVASTNYQASLGYIATTQATQTATLSTLSTLAAQGTNGASTSILIPTTSGTITLYATNNAAVYNVLSGAGSITLAADSGWNTTYSGCEVVLTLYYYNTGSTAYGSNIITNGLPAVTLSTTRTNIIVLDKAPYGTGFVEFNLGTCP